MIGHISGITFIRYADSQETERPKEKGQKDKQRSTKHTHKLKIE